MHGEAKARIIAERAARIAAQIAELEPVLAAEPIVYTRRFR